VAQGAGRRASPASLDATLLHRVRSLRRAVAAAATRRVVAPRHEARDA